jgi:hypothetical protein
MARPVTGQPAKPGGAKPRTSDTGASAPSRSATPNAPVDSPASSQAPARLRRGVAPATTGSFEESINLDPDQRMNTPADNNYPEHRGQDL